MMKSTGIKGHGAALITVVLWGTTFVSTKLLLRSLHPVEILFYRFVIGLLALFLVYPKRMGKTTRKQELTFAAAGLCGVTLYYLFENIALTFTSASNAGIIVSLAPFFTAILANWWLDGEKPGKYFFIGFLAAITGIGLISFNGAAVLQFSPKGDLLALLAAVLWAFYAIISRKISGFGFHTIQTTRRVFSYGLLFMIPAVGLLHVPWNPQQLAGPVNLLNILYLGLGASALCFVTWNLAVKALGAVKTSIYIYMVPVITVITSVCFLDEPVTLMSLAGTVLTLAGLLLSKLQEKNTGLEGGTDCGGH